ncbi:hypothetical protein [Solidesulfovibrio carbinolicus]|uniref:hypothetical protein n=1 Tax=Solidesulfovibrio carbinolicus TaxID=296842 RepID=UPI001F1A4F19|nr:hypothetical protein [Solidesulfovibrio carbinolicus]
MGKEDKITPSQRLLELIRKSSGAAGTAAPGASNAGEAVRRPTVGPPTAAVAQPDPVVSADPTIAPVVEEAVVTPPPAKDARLDAAAAANPRLVYDPYGAGLAAASYQSGVSWPGFGEVPPAKPADGAAFDPAMPTAGPGEAHAERLVELAVEATPADAPGVLAEALPELVLDLDAAPAPFGLAEAPDAPSAPAEAQPELVLDRDATSAPAAGSASEAETAVPGGGLPELVLDLDAAPTMFFTTAPVAAAPSDTPATPETAGGPGALAPSDTANAEEPPQAEDADKASGTVAESAPVAAADLAAVAASAGMASATTNSPKKRRGFNWRSLLPGGRVCHVGVDISATELVCVAVRGQDADFEVLGLESVPVPQGVEPGQPEFAALLGRALSGLCLPGQIPKVWAAAQSARSNIQFLTIPKVSSRQVDNAVYWTAKKDMGFDEADVVFDFERRGEVTEKGAVRLGAMAYTTPREAISLLQNDFAQAGFPLAGLTLEPFAHQNLYRRRIVDGPAEGATANLHVGRNWSRLEIVSNGNIMFVRVIKTSMSGMEQAVYDVLESRGLAAPAQPAKAPAGAPGAAGPREEVVLDLDALSGSAEAGLVLDLDAAASPATPEPGPQGPSPQPSTGETARPLEADHARELLDAVVYGCLSVDDCHPGYGLELDDVMDMLRPVASRLVRQVEMTLKHYRESLGQDQVTRLTVSGPLGGSRLFLDFIQEHVGLPCEALDPLAGRPLPAGTTLGGRLPGALFSQALGLALSDDGHTPSAFVTYKERAAKRASRLLEQGVLVGLAAVLAGMALLSFSAMAKRQTLERERDALNQRLAGYGASLDAAALARKSEELRTKIEAMQRYASRNRIVGIWEEALALAPDGVRIGSMTTECGPPDKPLDQAAAQAAKNLKDGKDPNAPVSRLIIEGVAIGDARLFDSMLASYVVALEGSPLLEDISVKRSELEGLEGGATGLRFVLSANLTESKP